MKSITLAATLLIAFLASVANLFAQAGDKQFIEEEKRQALERRVSYNQDFLLNYGGWFNSQYTFYDDEPDRDDRTVRTQDLRLWGDLEIARRWRVYGRVLNSLTDYNEGDQYKHHDNRWRLLRLDQGFVGGNLKDYAQRVVDDDISMADLQIGRQFLRVGAGLVLNNTLDGVRLRSIWGPVDFTILGARTKGSEDNLDQSHPDAENDRRYFYAAEVSYVKIANPRPYLFLLVQRDSNNEEHENVDQNYEYDSEYAGIGLKAALIKNILATMEFVYEDGESVANGSTESEDITAYAVTSALRYAPEFYGHPELSVGYMRGSGDKDRTSVTDSVGGNAIDSDDTNFSYYGFVQTGFVLFPRLSNIQIYRGGVSMKPLEKWRTTRDLDTGVTYYVYRKVKGDAGISDTDANLGYRDVGNEIDLYIRWRAISDIGITLYAGRFHPGDAYDYTKTRDYVSIGVTLSF